MKTLYPKYAIAPDGRNWQLLETKLPKATEKNPTPQEATRPVSWHANVEQAAVGLRERCIAAKCYTPDQKLTVEQILEAISESNAIIKAAIENTVYIQTQ